MSTAPSPPSLETLAESDALHRRVQCFAEGSSTENFDDLALDVFRFQAAHSTGYLRLLKTRSRTVRSWQDIPPVPVEAFRLARVAIHAPSLDQVRFESSGTTSSARSTHVLRTTSTYDLLSLRHGQMALRPEWMHHAVVVALAPHPGKPPTSSLGHMMRHFMTHFDGRSLSNEPHGVTFDPDDPQRWLLDSSGVNVRSLRRLAKRAKHREHPLMVLSTSFALAMLLDELDDEPIECPRRTLVMQTGGFKGRKREIPAAKLRADVAAAFKIPKQHVVSEYGMTELSSQLYEGVVPEAELSGPLGVYLAPPWLRATPVDPVALEPVPAGAPGLAKFVDLGNIDSAVAIVTEDLIRTRDGGIELLGRRRGAPSRGCSLSAESLLLRTR